MKLRNRIQYKIATLGIIGFIPFASGTAGSAVAWLLILFWGPSDISLFVLFLFLFGVGLVSAHNTEKVLGKDSGHIIIDEVCGYVVSVLLVPKTFGYLFAAFILFRLFDILKPPPIGKVEQAVPGGAGIMLDDVLAGIYANLCLQIFGYLFAGPAI